MTAGFGSTLWAIGGGHIPLRSTGPEPEFTSRDQLALLNTGNEEARIAITIHHAHREPVGPYELKLGGRRVRRVRFNDLIFPEAIPLGVPFGAIVRASVPIVVQVTRLDSGHAEANWMGTMAHPA